MPLQCCCRNVLFLLGRRQLRRQRAEVFAPQLLNGFSLSVSYPYLSAALSYGPPDKLPRHRCTEALVSGSGWKPIRSRAGLISGFDMKRFQIEADR